MYSSPMNRSVQEVQRDSPFARNDNLFGTNQDEPKAGFLFGNKRRSIAVSNTPQFLNSPANGPSAPSSDIFASPAPNALPNHMRDSATGSGKSVHWSPALIHEKNQGFASPSIKPVSSHTPNFQSPVVNAPPLRSLRDEIEPVKKAARRSMSIPVNNSLNQSVLSSASPADVASPTQEVSDAWVTVFGFPPEQAANVLKYFSRHGEVVSHQIPIRGNWMHIRYSCGIHARQALSRNATILDGSIRIGVVPCTEKELVGVEATANRNASMLNRSVMEQSILEEPEVDDTIPALTARDQNVSVLDNSMNCSRMSMASRTGMRSLAAAHDGRHVPSNVQPTKQDSIMNKLWNAVGF